MVNEELRACM